MGYYSLPQLGNISLSVFWAGVIALALSDSAFEAEIFRAGIQSVGRGQYEAAAVAAIRAHYARVAERFGLAPDVVHSWHAGIHPGCAHPGNASEDPDRWSNTVFTHPRFLHFHTCGDEAPGEICWMVLDPTVTVDGVALWRAGRLRAQAFAATRAALGRWPVLATLLHAPAEPVGLDGRE